MNTPFDPADSMPEEELLRTDPKTWDGYNEAKAFLDANPFDFVQKVLTMNEIERYDEEEIIEGSDKLIADFQPDIVPDRETRRAASRFIARLVRACNDEITDMDERFGDDLMERMKKQ